MERWKQFARFCIVGCSNTLIAYGIYLLTLRSLGPLSLAWDYLAGNAVSFLVSVLWSFYWNERFVFKVCHRSGRERLCSLLKTYISYAFSGLLLNSALSWVWVEGFAIDKRIAPLLNLAVTVPVNFLLNRSWAFKDKT